MKIKNLTVCAMIIALALVCSKIKIMSLPLGGSITLFSMLIISLPGYLFGLKYGFTSAFIYSLLKLLLGGYIFSPMQAIIDYIFSYTVFSISGLCHQNHKKHIVIIYFLIACTLRFIFACISGMVFFLDYAPNTMHPLIYNIIYNGSYIYLEAIASIILIIFIPSRYFDILSSDI